MIVDVRKNSREEDATGLVVQVYDDAIVVATALTLTQTFGMSAQALHR